jgi:hypothetical protein
VFRLRFADSCSSSAFKIIENDLNESKASRKPANGERASNVVSASNGGSSSARTFLLSYSDLNSGAAFLRKLLFLFGRTT